MRNRFKKGFTLIEISLFLGLSAILVVGIILSTRSSIEEQRYNDSVQDFTNFLRNLYSKASNIEIERRTNDQNIQEDGRSDKAVYGKLITFGEKYNLDGQANTRNEIFIYDVVGGADGNIGNGGDILSALKNLNAQVTTLKDVSGNATVYAPTHYNVPQRYTVNWDASIEITDAETSFKGALLIVRSPMSGTIYTYTLSTANNNHTVEVNEMVKNGDAGAIDPLANELSSGSFTNEKNIDFCIRSEGLRLYNGLRRNVRINASAHNSASVELIPLNEEGDKGNQCKRV